MHYIPTYRTNFFKFWWCEELDQLKKASIDACNEWKMLGKPKHGPIFDKRNSARLRYRSKIRDCQRSEDTFYTNELHAALMAKGGDTFWKCWRSKFENRVKINGVDGCMDVGQIAEKFHNHFSSLYKANSPPVADKLRVEFFDKLEGYSGLPIVSTEPFTTEMISNIINRLSKGKAAGLDGLSAEHLISACPLLSCVLSKLFNLMLHFHYVPRGFCFSYMIPLPKMKNTHSKTLTCNDFRGIAISSVLSKVFEHCLLDCFDTFFKI